MLVESLFYMIAMCDNSFETLVTFCCFFKNIFKGPIYKFRLLIIIGNISE